MSLHDLIRTSGLAPPTSPLASLFFPTRNRHWPHMAGFPVAPPLSSPPMSDIPRPAVRRKSSAQNLLSSFKPPASSPTPGGSISSATGAAYAAAVQTPSASVTPGREWDGQSVHSDTLSSTATLVANGTSAIAQGTSVEYLRDLVQKRIITLTYMRNVHEGCVSLSE